MKIALHLMILFFGFGGTVPAQTIPRTYGVGGQSSANSLPRQSRWSEKQAKTLIGTDLEYSSDLFRWNKVVTKDPIAEITTIDAQGFHDENSGRGANSSQVTLQQLGIRKKKVVQIAIRHPAAPITGGIIEIPGDHVLLKDQNTIVFSVCNVYFEAKRTVGPGRN